MKIPGMFRCTIQLAIDDLKMKMGSKSPLSAGEFNEWDQQQ